jgi:hypothetical protein
MTVSFTSRLSAETTPLNHAWEHTVGSSRALLALRADWQEQLRRCRDELGFRHVRFHALLTDDMGTLICHQEKPLRRSGPGRGRTTSSSTATPLRPSRASTRRSASAARRRR